MTKYIPLEDVMKLIKRANMVVYWYKIDELTESVQALPTIDPIAIIDEMIEIEKYKLDDLNPLWKLKQIKEKKLILEKAKERIEKECGWIPVSERLPDEEDKYFLCYFPDWSWWGITNFKGIDIPKIKKITHWMPLPSNP